MALNAQGDSLGFAEAMLRTDNVNGCATSPVAFLEGIYVEPSARRQGVARALADVVEQWARQMGCREFASDALLENVSSHCMHRGLGFEETERVVYFRKDLAG
jgi:aminoglycoside 6'-N-acetyltransferase I